MRKHCGGCDLVKDVSEFYARKLSKDGLQTHCKKCNSDYKAAWYLSGNQEKVAIQSAAWHKANPKSVAEYRRKARYGMPRGRFDEMVLEQGGKCGVSGCPNDIEVVDHNHKTGRVRALLCHQCNKLIGFLENSHDLGKSAIEYVLRHRESQP